MTKVTFTKTRKGIEEVETKANNLSRLERTVLIYIDGKRTTEELKVLPRVRDELSTILNSLEMGGYIVPSIIPSTTSSSTQAPSTVDNDVTIDRPSTSASPLFRQLPTRFEADKFNMAKHFMINTLNFFKGQYGATSLVRNIDRCQTHEELRGYFDAWHEAITSTHNGQKQERELRDKLLAVL